MRRSLAVAFALVLALAGLAGAAVWADFVISNSTANEDTAFRGFDAPSVAVADFDGDGRAELVAHNDNQVLYVLSATEPRVLAELRPDYPSGWGVRPITSPLVADVDADGRLDIVVVTSAASVCVFEFESGSSGTSMDFEKEWCRRMNAYDSNAAADGGAAVADVDGDGKLEIFAQTESRGLYAFEDDGRVRWAKDASAGNADPLVTDLENDGRFEVVFFSDGGLVRVVDASGGGTKWAKSASSYVWPGSIPVAGNAADLDGDGDRELVYVARDAHDDENYENNHFMLFVRDKHGNLLWRAQPPWGNPMSYTHPVLEDLDGDGDREILLQDWNTIGHKPGDWEQLGAANVFAYDKGGSLLWRVETNNPWSNDDVLLADYDGDGEREVVTIINAGLAFLDPETGAVEDTVSSEGWSTGAARAPVAGDLDGDGLLEIAFPVHSSTRGGAFVVYASDAPCRVTWGGWANPDPCDPLDGSGGTGGTTDPPPDEFDATFTDPGGNEWWVEVTVSANDRLTGVDARVDGGAWRTLELKSWGDWAESFRVPEGSEVQFRARSESGAEDLSGCYTWTSATPTTCDEAGGGDGGDGAVVFDHRGGNEWWVEVDVEPRPDAVEAMDTGGDWRALKLRDWGNWAGSFHIEPGHEVRFRAFADGAWTESCWFSHPAGAERCDGEVPDGGDDGNATFDASFTNVRGNEWWVETDVSANEALAGVQARVDDGEWRNLEPTDWGSWAASFRVPDGATVTFRATSADGDTDTSEGYAWPP